MTHPATDDGHLSDARLEHLLIASEYSKTAEALITFYRRNREVVKAAERWNDTYEKYLEHASFHIQLQDRIRELRRAIDARKSEP